MTETEFDALKKLTLLRQRQKTNLVEHEIAIKKLLDLDVSLPVILEWLVGKYKVETTLPALRRFIRRTLGKAFYDDFLVRNGWQKTKQEKSSSLGRASAAHSTRFGHRFHGDSATCSTSIRPGQSERSDARFSG